MSPRSFAAWSWREVKSMRRIEKDGSVLHLLPAIKGLVSEAEKVRQAIEEVGPDVIALSVSKEELSALRVKSDYEKYELSDIELVYKTYLEHFGEVRLPPPCYVKALDLSEERGLPIVPIDMNEDLFTDSYCLNVGGWDLIQESIFSRRMYRKRFDLSNPEAFVNDWDAKVNSPKGFRKLNREKERHMADALLNLSKRYRKVLAIIELERMEGVEQRLHV